MLTVSGWHVRRGLTAQQAANAIVAALTQRATQQVRLDVDETATRPSEFPEEPHA